MSTCRCMHDVAGRQNGVVLITSLILMVIMTLLAVSMLKTSIVELKIGGAGQVAARNIANAESELTSFINRNNFPGGSVIPNWVAATAPASATSYGTLESVRITLPSTENGCAEEVDNQMNTTIRVLYRDIRAEASSVLGGSVAVHQGVRITVASCS